MSSSRRKSILELTANEAHQFFLKNESYTNVDLPPYFCFEELLNKLSIELSNQSLFSKLGDNSVKQMADTVNLNHIIYANKDGNLSWRPFQFIHPLAYIALVNQLTNVDNWSKIQRRFRKLSSYSTNITCLSIPVESTGNNSNQAEQIHQWWEGIEQQSIFLALEYEYIFDTDIADCYSSIYTHSLAWAIDGKKIAKTRNYRNNKNILGQSKYYLGNKIDTCIQQMQNRQTNGIPQGSVLMDFVVEILFCYLDALLTNELNKQEINEYKILRYRDDYRIFVKNKTDGEKIIRILSELLQPFGLKLNANKTSGSDDIITKSLKADKLASLELLSNQKLSIQKKLYLLREHGKKFPNSGSLVLGLMDLRANFNSLFLSPLHAPTELVFQANSSNIRLKICFFLKKIINKIKLLFLVKQIVKDNQNFPTTLIKPILSILADIAINNPRTLPICCAFISDLLKAAPSQDKNNCANLIWKKLKGMPNSGFAQIWLQRIFKNNLSHYLFDEKLCKQLDKCNFAVDLWDISWIDITSNSANIENIMKNTYIICWDKFDELDETISNDEIRLFMRYPVYTDDEINEMFI